MILLIIVFSFLVSTLSSVTSFKNRNNKWFSVFLSFCINTIILVTAVLGYYYLDSEARLFGFGHTNLYLLIFFIPILTWINYLILEFARKLG